MDGNINVAVHNYNYDILCIYARNFDTSNDFSMQILILIHKIYIFQ